jgi:ABC-2 type transport system permease protein
MIRQLQAELRKLFTIRSTYILLLICLAITVFFAFYAEGFKVSKPVTDPHYLYSEVSSAVTALSFLLSMVGVMLVTHEYRYNTIMYTLTSANRRWKVLLAKFVAVSIFMIAAAVVFGALSPLLTSLGLHLKGTSLVAQTLPLWDTAWRAIFYGWAYGMLAFGIAVIIRNQVGAIIALFAIPSTVEPLLGFALHDNVKYLPFSALNNVTAEASKQMSPGKAAGVVLVYVVVVLLVAAILFKRRDAN